MKYLEKKMLRKMPPYFVTGLLFSLIPLKSKAAREEAVFILRNGRWDWKEKNEDGYQLHTGMIRGGRVDLAAEAARNIRKRDAKNPELSQVWAALLTYLIQRQHRTAALSMMEKGVLKSENWRERFEILGKKGWKKSTQSRGEEIKLADEYAEWAEKRKYPKDRRGRLMKINDRARIRFLRGYEQEREKLRKNRRKDVTVQM